MSNLIENVEEDRSSKKCCCNSQEKASSGLNSEETPNVFNWFTIILKIGTVLVGLTHFVYGCYFVVHSLLQQMRIERLILFDLLTCQSTTREGESLIINYYFIVHGVLSLMTIYVFSSNTGQILLFWIFSLFGVNVIFVFAYIHSLFNQIRHFTIQKEILLTLTIFLIVNTISFIIIILYYFHLNQYIFLYDREKSYRTNRIINREISVKRLDRFTLLEKLRSWGGKVQAVRLIEKLQFNNIALDNPNKEDLELNLDEALFAFAEINGISNLRIYTEPSNEDQPKKLEQKSLYYYRDRYRYTARTCPTKFSTCFKSRNKIRPAIQQNANNLNPQETQINQDNFEEIDDSSSRRVTVTFDSTE